ncbi:hypothetical protein GLYMA_20G071633v4 [Glycine max]|nr:hypothetical protein GLYMA_20G071633v4 [Glycine max]KAH1034964.1 hypothetical protein GYH30_055093 [Glycine max]
MRVRAPAMIGVTFAIAVVIMGISPLQHPSPNEGRPTSQCSCGAPLPTRHHLRPLLLKSSLVLNLSRCFKAQSVSIQSSNHHLPR